MKTCDFNRWKVNGINNKAKDLRVEYTGRDILDIDKLELYDYDRIGLVGANAAGKSTLLKVLLGELTPPGCKINRLGQFTNIPQLGEANLQEEKDFATLRILGVEKLELQTMSGGEETRLKIAQAFSAQVHGLVADEPTSHLEREGIDFLIEQLRYFSGALQAISNDRYFLDEVVDNIQELKDGKITEYWGNYTDYLRQKDEVRYQNTSDSLQNVKGQNKLLMKSENKHLKLTRKQEEMQRKTNLKVVVVRPIKKQVSKALGLMMKEYAGTIVFITHDKHLLENVADVIYEIKDKRVNLI